MSEPAKSSALRELPSVDQLLKTEVAVRLREISGAERLTTIAREVTDQLRSEILANQRHSVDQGGRDALLKQAMQRMESLVLTEEQAGLRHVINATGVILHTNLGRAPLSEEARRAVTQEAAGYCTLEYDSATGTRGRRGARVEQLLTDLTGAQAALVVNNCAAAALLILSVLAHDGETIVSRGELVEIGGDFRVPDVMANSGTRMVDVGTTNRTHLDDYRRAINDSTRLLMRVHPSNYRVVGFTTAPTRNELATLAHEKGLKLYEDAGSGVLQDLSEYGLQGEPIISESLAQGADVVSFSGDKLLGGPQAGLIVGSRTIIERLRKHSLYRALRVDKLILAALQATLNAYRRGTLFNEIPSLQMLALTKSDIAQRAATFLASLGQTQNSSELSITVIDGESAIGGGSGPATHPATVLLAIEHKQHSADELERRLRCNKPPIIGRVSEGKLLLDLRTVFPTEEPELGRAISNLLN
ncbi:MAG: L-seryl-tRNA(Sec) selenium transferase [Pyrinomonadaceae bacterium]